MLKLFSGNTFIDRQWQRGRDTARLFDCFFLFLFFCSFVLSLQTFCFYPSCSERFDFYQRSQWWHQASGFALHLLRSLVFRRSCWRMVLGMSCVLWCTISVTHTHTHPSLLSAGARRLCLFYCGLGRAPVWAACHSPGYSMYSESCASFFFFFLSCVVFFQIIVWQRWLWWLFCFLFFQGLARPHVLEFGWKCTAVRGW